MSNGANLSQKVKKTEVEKDIEIIEIMIEIKVEILKILEENVLYAISMVTTQEIVLNLIQEEDILIKENHTVYIINIEEAEAEADQDRENIIILPIKENGEIIMKEMKEVEIQAEIIIIGIMAEKEKIRIHGEKILWIVKVEVGVGVKVEIKAEAGMGIEMKIDIKIEIEIVIEIWIIEIKVIKVIVGIDIMIKKKKIVVLMED